MTYVAGASRSLSMRSSRTGSPQTFQPTLPPPPDAVAGAMAYRGPPPSIVRRGSGLGGEQDQPGIPPYYVPVPPRSYHSPHPDSPAHASPYVLPPVAPVPTLYSTPGVQPQPPPVPFAGTPPYPMYPPYGYPYPPYVYWQPGTSPVAPEGVPPPMMLGRPPLPGENEGAAPYLDQGFVLPPPARYERPANQLPQMTQSGSVEGVAAPVERGRRSREFSFGTIDTDPQADQPDGAEPGVLGLRVTGEDQEEEGTIAKSAPPFAIGVAPGEPGPARIRSRTQSKGRTLAVGDTLPAVSRTVSGQSDQPSALGEETVERDLVEELEASVKVIDLTKPGETKWEFGTTKQDGAEVIAEVSPRLAQANGGEHSVQPLPATALGVTGMDPVAPPYIHPSTYGAPPLPPIMTTTNGLGSAHSPSYAGPSALPPLSAYDSQADDLSVKDFGYGFGRGGPAPYSAGGGRRDWQDREHYNRPRRGSFGGGYGYERGGHERGGYSGRRARGRGYEGRGGYHARTHSRGSGAYHASQSRQPPFVVQQPPLLQTDVNGYYAPQPSGTTYYALPYDHYAGYSMPAYAPSSYPVGPPVPHPVTDPGFPLDPVRYRLLGQLEYYLSPQNMTGDTFLKNHVRVGALLHRYHCLLPCRWTHGAGSRYHSWQTSSAYGA